MAGKQLTRPTNVPSAESSPQAGSKIKAARKNGLVPIATWSHATPQLIATLISLVTDDTDLISFSKTSDGGALHLYLKAGNDEDSIYFKPHEDVDAGLEELISIYRS